MTKTYADYYAALCERANREAERYDAEMERLESEVRKAHPKQKGRARARLDAARDRLSDRLKALALPEMGDLATLWSLQDLPRQDDAHRAYRRAAVTAAPIDGHLVRDLTPQFMGLPDPSWLGIEVHFVLHRPWYSKDNRVFHFLDNPIRREWVHGYPYMPSSSWKGLVRWACSKCLESTDGESTVCGDDHANLPMHLIHLFGNDRSEEEKFREGSLVFYPTFFSSIGFEVINPHSRKTRAGTQPIYYEVVPHDTAGSFQVLYAPMPGAAESCGVEPAQAIPFLLDAIEALFTKYGISAKRTAGWGTAEITKWSAYRKGFEPLEMLTLCEFKEAIESWCKSAH